MSDRLPFADVPELLRTIPVEAIQAQRWFGAKGREVCAITVRDFTTMPGAGDHILALLDIVYTDGGSDTYFLPLALEDGHGDILGEWTADSQQRVIRDGLADPSLCAALIAAVADNATTPGARGVFEFQTTAAFADIVGPALDLPVHLLPAHQSNTLVRFGERALLKAYRRPVPGINPDVEVSHFLTTRTSFRNIPRLAGTVEYRDRESARWPLAALLAYVPNEGNAWERTLREVTAHYRGEAEPELVSARRLGERTGQLHAALASRTDDRAFAPEPVMAEDLRQWAQSLRSELRETVRLLTAKAGHLPPEARADAETLVQGEPRLLASIDTLDGTRAAACRLSRIRVHGDYHLGQVLVTGSDYVIIDFEGEPARTLEQRRSKQIVLKDVAGILRSFNYAGFVAWFDLKFAGGSDDRRAAWESQVRSAFLDGYRGELASVPVTLLPDSTEGLHRLLGLFELEKALYEVRYEINSRPDWLRIPLSGIQRLLT